MKSHSISQIAFASQLFAASAGLYLAAPSLANAQTPAIQKLSKADRELTQKVRESIVSDKTLTGTVKSEEEKKPWKTKRRRSQAPAK